MKVILTADVEKLGHTGTVKNVSDGYARNFLIPRKLAQQATPEAIQWVEKTQEKRKQLREQQVQKLRDQAAKMNGTALSFTRKVGDAGKLFGSVGKSDIVDSLKASGYVVDKNSIMLTAAIKEVGDSEVEVRLHPEAVAKIKVSVLARS